MERPECDLCSSPINIRVLMPCNHNNICLECFVRFNRNYNGNHCYFCQKPIEKGKEPVAVTDMSLNYEQARKKNPQFNANFNLYYTDPIVPRALDELYHFICPQCRVSLPTIDTFVSHMKTHNQCVCCICYSSGRFLPETVPIFSQNKYREHLKQHPRCICCNQTCFDQNTLAEHMREKHHRCELCAKVNRILWFKDTQDLIKHNEKEHFVCHHPSCSSDQLIAFMTRGELLMHLQKVHGEREREIDFTVDFQSKVTEQHQKNESRQRMIELNNKLMKRLNECFRDDPQAIQVLKGYAKQLIENKINCQEFYKHFSDICREKKDLIFCDMVASMPDPRKRAELFRIHNGMASLGTMPKSKSNPQINRNQKKLDIQTNRPQNQFSAPQYQQPQEEPIPAPQPAVQRPAQNQQKKKKKKIVLSCF